MATEHKKSLFARTGPSPKRLRSFLGLPGELRNRIYDYYYETLYRVEVAAASTQSMERPKKVFKMCLPICDKNGKIYAYKQTVIEDGPQTLIMHRRLGRYLRVHGVQTKWETSLSALTLVCKQVYTETLPFLYRNTTFVFDAPKRIRQFTKCVPKRNLSYISNIELHYNTYGEPLESCYCVFRERHLFGWESACKTLSKSLVNLEKLEVKIHETSTDPHFSIQKVASPFLHFRRLSLSKKLMSVKIQWTSQAHSIKVWLPLSAVGKEAVAANTELMGLCEDAIARAVLGWNEPDAMAELRDGWARHERFQLLLNFL